MNFSKKALLVLGINSLLYGTQNFSNIQYAKPLLPVSKAVAGVGGYGVWRLLHRAETQLTSPLDHHRGYRCCVFIAQAAMAAYAGVKFHDYVSTLENYSGWPLCAVECMRESLVHMQLLKTLKSLSQKYQATIDFREQQLDTLLISNAAGFEQSWKRLSDIIWDISDEKTVTYLNDLEQRYKKIQEHEIADQNDLSALCGELDEDIRMPYQKLMVAIGNHTIGNPLEIDRAMVEKYYKEVLHTLTEKMQTTHNRFDLAFIHCNRISSINTAGNMLNCFQQYIKWRFNQWRDAQS